MHTVYLYVERFNYMQNVITWMDLYFYNTEREKFMKQFRMDVIGCVNN